MIGKTSLKIDTGTLKRLEELSRLPDEAKIQVFLVVDALFRDFKAKQAYASRIKPAICQALRYESAERSYA
jgi:hypothetical protein